jgi:hypothetical protein
MEIRPGGTAESAMNPDDVFARAQRCEDRGDFDQAEQCLLLLLKRGTNRAQRDYGAFLNRRGRHTEALKVLKRKPFGRTRPRDRVSAGLRSARGRQQRSGALRAGDCP